MTINRPLSSKAILSARRASVFKFVGLQFSFVCLVSVVLWLWIDIRDSYSFFVGAMSAFLPSLYMVLNVFGSRKVKSAQATVKSFYRGEAVKFVLTVLLLSLSMMYINPLEVSVFFIGFGVMILSHWLSAVVVR